jgi:16S rRNA (adenine1518-N6/adenine1519-N6)-dimethyltransferase
MPVRKRVNVPKGATVQTSPRKPKMGQHFLVGEGRRCALWKLWAMFPRPRCWRSGRAAGAITDLLARRARRLIAVELDRVLSAQLRMKFNMQPNVEIIEGDILTIELDTVFGAKPGSLRTGLNFAPEPARVVGNLPYYITSDIFCACWNITATFRRL